MLEQSSLNAWNGCAKKVITDSGWIYFDKHSVFVDKIRFCDGMSNLPFDVKLKRNLFRNVKIFIVSGIYWNPQKAELLLTQCSNLTEIHVLDCDQIFTESVLNSSAHKCPLVTHFNFSGSHLNKYRLMISGLGAVLRRLTVLNLSRCVEIDDEFLVAMLRHAVKLKHIDISYCLLLTPISMDAIALHCIDLESLHITECCKLNDAAICDVAHKCLKLSHITGIRSCLHITNQQQTEQYVATVLNTRQSSDVVALSDDEEDEKIRVDADKHTHSSFGHHDRRYFSSQITFTQVIYSLLLYYPTLRMIQWVARNAPNKMEGPHAWICVLCCASVVQQMYCVLLDQYVRWVVYSVWRYAMYKLYGK